jgi:hypothetical protein
MRSLLDGWEDRAQQVNRRRPHVATDSKAEDRPRNRLGRFKIQTPEDNLEKFFSKIAPPNERGCREWQGSRLASGYGQCRIANKCYVASRVAWILAHGPIPDGLFACHRCDNPPCCTPEHLFLGTQDDNMGDCAAKGRIRGNTVCCGEINHMAKITNETVLEIRRLSSEMSQQEIARTFGITRANVGQILRRKTWKHL